MNVTIVHLLVLVVVLFFDASRTIIGVVNEESCQEECFRGHVELVGK